MKSAPIVIVHFRPQYLDKTKAWAGEFGFDWMRIGDTTLFGDHKYEDIVGKQYQKWSRFRVLATGMDTHEGEFGKNDAVDDQLFEDLKKTYKSFNPIWIASGVYSYKEYLIPWMSLAKLPDDLFKLEYTPVGRKKATPTATTAAPAPTKIPAQTPIDVGARATLQLKLEIAQPADYLEFEVNTNFIFSPNKIKIAGMTGMVTLPKPVTVTCVKEFKVDSPIVINAFKGTQKNIAGKINVFANHTSLHKELKVLFVAVDVPSSVSKPFTDPIDTVARQEKQRLQQYLRQAYIHLSTDSDVITLDLSKSISILDFQERAKRTPHERLPAWDFKSPAKNYLHLFMESELKKQIKSNKYDNHLLAFVVNGEGTYNGYTIPNSRYFVIFTGRNKQTFSHECFHTMGLAHSFTNSEVMSSAKVTYESLKTDNITDYSHFVSEHGRCSTWYWQWLIMRKTVGAINKKSFTSGKVSPKLSGGHSHGTDHIHTHD